MSSIGSRIDETGTLIRDGGGFALRRDTGGRWKLDMHRVSVDHVCPSSERLALMAA
jgi:hypothetical protein